MKIKENLAPQVALIERVRGELDIDLDEMAGILVIKPDTMRKIARGYQSAGRRLLSDIERLPNLPSLVARKKVSKSSGSNAAPSRRPKVPALAHRIAYIMANALPEEELLVTKIIDAAFDQIAKRMESKNSKNSTIP